MVVSGVEALLRWRHPERGVIGPTEFIPMLEETGLILEVGRWVLHQACAQAMDWQRKGRHLSVSVNVSMRQLETDALLTDVADALTASGLASADLVIEVTETVLMRDTTATIRRLGQLKRLGVRVAIDDFGTGYSSLAYLKQFPVDSLKIDRSFIAGIDETRESTALMHTLVQLGRALGLETLAEGIEDPGQLARLQGENCDSGQGYLLGRPVEPDELERFLVDWDAAHPPIPT
jgi:EAL domain-containing protein (putative c-di-GMP-specific phosphodiesterase class I)